MTISFKEDIESRFLVKQLFDTFQVSLTYVNFPKNPEKGALLPLTLVKSLIVTRCCEFTQYLFSSFYFCISVFLYAWNGC